MPVRVCLRLANVDLHTDFEIEPNVWLRKASEEEIRKKYPVDSTFIGVSRAVAESWFKHRVEVVLEGSGKGKDLFRLDLHEEHDATVNSVLHSFLLSGVQKEVPASVTHYRYDTPLRSYGHTRNVDRVQIEPTLLSNKHLHQLQHTYQFLRAAKADKILRTALDRFLFGLSRPSHYPTEANRPNWDKVVDYVIAMETLFVPSKGPDVTYRLAVHGASLICLATSDHPTATYRALKCLYGLRSKIVHGGTSDVVKDARKFLTCVGRIIPNPNDRLRIFHAICDHVESWLRAVLFYLGSISINRRPYSAKDDTGWEELLWPPPSPGGNDYY